MQLDTTKALITLEEAKEYLKVSGVSDDPIISALINGVSERVTNFLGRDLVSKTHTEYYSGDGGRELILRNTPVISINSINADTLRVWGDSTAVDVLANVLINKNTGIIETWNNLSHWSRGQGHIKIVYVAGYTTAFSGGTMPHDIRLAVKRILDQQYRTGYSNRKLDVSSESIGDANTSFRDGSLPADALEMLSPYRAFMSSPHFSHAD